MEPLTIRKEWKWIPFHSYVFHCFLLWNGYHLVIPYMTPTPWPFTWMMLLSEARAAWKALAGSEIASLQDAPLDKPSSSLSTRLDSLIKLLPLLYSNRPVLGVPPLEAITPQISRRASTHDVPEDAHRAVHRTLWYW